MEDCIAMKKRKNQALFSPALAFVLCLLFCAAIPLPLSAAGIQGTDASDSGRGSHTSGTAAAVPQADRVTYQEGFFYESLSEEIKARITGISYGEGCIVPYEDLRYLHVLYIDFQGLPQAGEIICNKAIAQDWRKFSMSFTWRNILLNESV